VSRLEEVDRGVLARLLGDAARSDAGRTCSDASGDAG
jgi:hypothetical protein